ncbi:cell envelope biogenesis protein LolA [Methylosinus sporium]|uniref:Cell envelope biogenesis protein LolA n=1 Tax=Methylosinus sporium TaxID=428 RepID=A0A549T644_METSR|nr:outer-membrane lipoprotein carrier protein LolA [Methylosinus sporium]TRL37316.1 cell envelope biogenesis protein LolA [Methylosinus sporium]
MKSPLAAALVLALLAASGAQAVEPKKKPHPAPAAKAQAGKPAAKGKPAAADAKAKPKPADPKTAQAKPADPKAAPPAAKPPAPAPAVPDPAKAAVGAAAVGGAAAAVAVAAQPPAPLTRDEAIKRAEASLNSSPVMIADFVQIGGDGRRAEGKLYVHKVGRMRFEYAQPATMEVVSDGVQVAVRDRKLNTQDLYFINQTPLKFLLNEKVDLQKDVKLVDVVIDDAGASISIEDKATFGGTSKIKLIFDSKTFDLKQWQVSDPQGYETLVSLFNIDRGSAPDANLFKIDKGSLLDFH